MLGKARQTARTLAAMREINADRHRLERFNKEQREQLTERLSEFGDRLPQQLVMAYHHLVMLSGDGNGGMQIQQVDLGPARITDTVPSRVRDYLVGNDRMLDDTLSPAALLSSRFPVMPRGRPGGGDRQAPLVLLPAAPPPQVGKRRRAPPLFGCRGRDSNLRAGFRPQLGRAGCSVEVRRAVRSQRDPVSARHMARPGGGYGDPHPGSGRAGSGAPAATRSGACARGTTEGGTETPEQSGQRLTDPIRVRIRVDDVPADKVRDVIKVAMLPWLPRGQRSSPASTSWPPRPTGCLGGSLTLWSLRGSDNSDLMQSSEDERRLGMIPSRPGVPNFRGVNPSAIPGKVRSANPRPTITDT